MTKWLMQIEPRRWHFRRKLGIPENAFVAVYAGNVGVASNAELLVEALAKLKE